jgi:YidC/Oxa1 family membrane protein insertase
LGVDIKSEGLEDIFVSEDFLLNWKTDLFRNSKSIDYEGRYTQLTYGYEDDKVDNLSLSGKDEEIENKVRWVSYRQHFFSSILIPNTLINDVSFKSEDLTVDENLDNIYTKKTYNLI